MIFSTHDIQEAERYGGRLLVLADGESLFDGSPRRAARGRCAARRPRRPSRDFETAFVAFLHHRGHCDCRRGMSLMRPERVARALLKDLQILRRSPLQAVLLVAYPVLIAVLVGFAISPDSEQAAGRLPQRNPARHAGHRRRCAAARRRRRATGSAGGSSASASRTATKRSTRSSPATRWRR